MHIGMNQTEHGYVTVTAFIASSSFERACMVVVLVQHPSNIALTGKSTLYKLRFGQL